jgi:hypothetical protein
MIDCTHVKPFGIEQRRDVALSRPNGPNASSFVAESKRQCMVFVK